MNERLFHAYQTLKFQENTSNCFSVAALKRKTLSFKLCGSMELKESNCVIDFLLNEDFRNYGKTVDNKNSDINNYGSYVLSFFSNYENDDKKHWKSVLKDFITKKYLKSFTCSKSNNCKNVRLTSEFLKKIKYAFTKYEGIDDIEITEKCKVIFENTISEKSSFLENYIVEPKIKRYTSHSKNEVMSKSKVSLFFQTAKDELQIQKDKKFSKNNSTLFSDKNYGYGSIKKSLGTRKGGIFGKFTPPVRCTEKNEHEQEVRAEMNEVVDERLKNIDPAMIEIIKNEIMDCNTKVTWNDIAGLHFAKSTIQEIVVWPMLRPDIFTGLRRPPRGILLFGPPGTGKTLIGKCIASQSNSTFFSISASSLTSKWVGEGEKMVRTLFAVAKVHQPSVVFIDEIDSLLSQRSESEHESSRRIKTEFLVQLDGAGTGDEDKILIIGATNRPQELDEAARRRLVKRLYIPLPDEDARKQIIENLISTECHCLMKSEIDNIAKLTKGYSGADVKNLCQEASLGPIRSIPPLMIKSINPEEVRPVNSKDFESALSRIKSSVSEKDLDIYMAWDKQYGCGLDSQF